VFETNLDATYAWIGLAMVSVATAGVVGAFPASPPPDASGVTHDRLDRGRRVSSEGGTRTPQTVFDSPPGPSHSMVEAGPRERPYVRRG